MGCLGRDSFQPSSKSGQVFSRVELYSLVEVLMKIPCLLILSISLSILYSVSGVKASDEGMVLWRDVTSGIYDTDIKAVTLTPQEPIIAYIASKSNLYRARKSGQGWENIFSVGISGVEINTIYIDPFDSDTVYLGTTDGLYKSKDGGNSWQRIFKGIGGEENRVFAIAVDYSGAILVGTGRGMFASKDHGLTWVGVTDVPKDSIIYYIAVSPVDKGLIYIATEKGIYKSDDEMRWNRIFASPFVSPAELEYDGEEDEKQQEVEQGVLIRTIAIDPDDRDVIYAGTTKGVYVSKDAGSSWSLLEENGLLDRDIHHLIVDRRYPGHLYAATSGGVFMYDRFLQRWTDLYKGLTSTDVRYIAISHGRGTAVLWAAARRGVFRARLVEGSDGGADIDIDEILKERFPNEPRIEEIQAAAIRYGEVHPDKIARWRKDAALKAWLPDLKVSYDKGRDWSSSGYFYGGVYRDDDITYGKDRGWSVSLTWELGDLIWNDAQTSIDVRSRLMVQLRDDLLNEVTRLYFERRRLQIDMVLNPPSTLKEKMEKELRLQELTARIDALTGFYLSKRLGKVKER